VPVQRILMGATAVTSTATTYSLSLSLFAHTNYRGIRYFTVNAVAWNIFGSRKQGTNWW
jgi:hypothetical protein